MITFPLWILCSWKNSLIYISKNMCDSFYSLQLCENTINICYLWYNKLKQMKTNENKVKQNIEVEKQ